MSMSSPDVVVVDPLAAGIAVPPFSSVGERIVAVMITGKDAHHALLARHAVLNFLEQSYPNRELLIINDGDYRFDVRGVGSERVREVRVPQRECLGALRNRGLAALSEGTLWAQWDDDDYRHPQLLAEQYQVLLRRRVDACALGAQVKYASSIDAAWEDKLPSHLHGFAGTLLLRKRADVSYPALSRGEDSAFWSDYMRRFTFTRWENPAHYYVRLIHGHNTWNDDHFGVRRRRPGERKVSRAAKQFLERSLPRYLFLRTSS